MKIRINQYIKRCVKQSSDHREYENHKRYIEILAGGNWVLYEYGIKKLVRKMGI